MMPLNLDLKLEDVRDKKLLLKRCHTAKAYQAYTFPPRVHSSPGNLLVKGFMPVICEPVRYEFL